MREGKYLNLWKRELPIILSTIEKGGSEKGLKLSAEMFNKSGDSTNSGYGFRLDIINGIVPTKSGSAVARDLKEILDSSTLFKNIASKKQITIQMGKDFCLNIKVHNISSKEKKTSNK